MSIAKVIEGRDQQIIQCSPQDTVRQAANLLAGNRIGALPVIEHGKVIGIFSERDLLYCVAKEGPEALHLPIREVMTAPALTISRQNDVLEALSLMTRRRIRHLPVVENGRLLAFLSIGDLVKYRMDRIESEARMMREYITTA